MSVKNRSQLLSGDLNESQKKLRNLAIECLERGLIAVKPQYLIEKSIKIHDNSILIQDDIYHLNQYNKICIIGGGKATAEMTTALEKILDNFNIHYEGVVNIPQGLEIKESQRPIKIVLNFATHPIPNEKGVKGTKKMLKLVKNTSKKDLIICLISGGGSALLSLPKKGISLKDLQYTNSLLLASGASIHEINAVRKHLSDFKGGNLAKFVSNVSGATLITLIVSDVVGNNLDTIASGPTVPDLTTYKDALEILNKYELNHKVPKSIIKALNNGLKKRDLENPKTNDPCFKNVKNYLIGSVNSAIQEILTTIPSDFETEYFSDRIIGEASEFGKELYHIILQYTKQDKSEKVSIKRALLGSGELTVTIRGEGKGGRNQEMLLSFLDYIKDKQIDYTFLILAANLDGIEGNSKAMGAIVDNFTLDQMVLQNLNTSQYLANNDSNSFFNLVKSEIITGPTGCNVNDIVLIFMLEDKYN